MKSNALVLCASLGLLLFVAGGAVASAAENLIPNPDFSKARGDRPEGWSSETWSGTGQFRHVEEGRSGGQCVMIASTSGGDLSWQTRVTLPGSGIYRLSGWIKTEKLARGEGRGAQLNIHERQTDGRTNALRDTNDWTQVELTFQAQGAERLTINCLFGGWGLSSGKAWFDDIALERVGDVAPVVLKPVIAVNAQETRRPLSKYIYSQFIEHLGRCIYGGIWAEMLEDRKFYFPITPDYNPYRRLQNTAYPVVGASPWKIVGPAAGVTMETEGSFVGDQSPRIQAGSGIVQQDLALVKGKRYVGYVWLKALATGSKATVALDPSREKSVTIDEVSDAYSKVPFTFTADRDSSEATLAIQVVTGDCLVGTVSLMPADHVHGMRPDTLKLLKELNAPMYRWPGGNFVSGYNWRDGIGDRDRRPPRKNPAWTGVEHNDFGVDDFLRFCELVGADPLVVVNTGFGDAYSAAQEVEYCNGSADTIGGAWRIQNGRAKPYGVRWWGVGNEMFGSWQLGYMSLGQYVLKHNEVARAMLQVDPEIQMIGVGDAGNWSEGMLRNCLKYMDELSEHFYCQRRADVVSHVAQIPDRIRSKAEFHRRMWQEMPQLKEKDLRVSMDEWNYWYGPHEFGELGTRYFLQDALGIAAGVHEYSRTTDIISSAFYAQTVNVIGCIKTSKTEAQWATTGLVLQLYRNRFGTIPVAVEAKDAGGIDLAAAWTPERDAFTIGVVNPYADPQTIDLKLAGVSLQPQGTLWRIAGDDPMAYNEPGKPLRVAIEESVATLKEAMTVPGYSISLYRFDVR